MRLRAPGVWTRLLGGLPQPTEPRRKYPQPTMAKPYQKAPRYCARIKAASKTDAVSVQDIRNHRSEPDRIAANQIPRKRMKAIRPAIEGRNRIGLLPVIPQL